MNNVAVVRWGTVLRTLSVARCVRDLACRLNVGRVKDMSAFPLYGCLKNENGWRFEMCLWDVSFGNLQNNRGFEVNGEKSKC